MTAIQTSPYALTTPERVKVRLGIDAAITTFDATISQMVTAVTDFIEARCNRHFLQTSYANELYDGYNLDGSIKRVLVLKNYPLAAAPSVFQYRTGAKSSPVWVSFPADTYQEDLLRGIIRTSLPPGWQNIRVSYIAGYIIAWDSEWDNTKHTLPHDISDLAERLTIKLFKRRESEGRSSEGFQQSQITWADLISPEDQSTLDDHSMPSFA